MDLILTILLWLFVIGIFLSAGRFVIGIVMYIIMAIAVLIYLPIEWIFNKVKGA